MTIALDIFRALADATRLRILALLRSMELSVGELAQVLGQSQPRVIRHVKILCDAGLAERRKEGSWVFVALGKPARVEPILSSLDSWGKLESDHWAVADAARLAAVRADRAASAAGWFEANAGQWDAIRSLHVAEDEVEAAIRATLADAPIGRLVDIGTGTGRMIELFGKSAILSIGIDRSSEMLRLARVKLEAAGIPSSLRQGDMYALPIDDGSADTVIIHQVLHYAHSPASAIDEAARVLAPGGRLLIVDFAAHEREELRTSDAHIRLGFDDETMTGWFKAAGIHVDHVEHLEGGELTVTVWRGSKPPLAQRRAA